VTSTYISGCEYAGGVFQNFSSQNSSGSNLEALPGVWTSAVDIASVLSTGNNIATVTVATAMRPIPAVGSVIVLSNTGQASDNGTFIVCDSTVNGSCSAPTATTFNLIRSTGTFFNGTASAGGAAYPFQGIATGQEYTVAGANNLSSTSTGGNVIGTFATSGTWFPPPLVGAEVKIFSTTNYNNDGFNSANRWYVCGPPMTGCSTPTSSSFNFWMVGASAQAPESAGVAFISQNVGFLVTRVSSFRGIVAASIVNKSTGYIPPAGVLVSGLLASGITGDGFFAGIHTEWVGIGCYSQTATPVFQDCNGSSNFPNNPGGIRPIVPAVVYADSGSAGVTGMDVSTNLIPGDTSWVCAPDGAIRTDKRIHLLVCGGPAQFSSLQSPDPCVLGGVRGTDSPAACGSSPAGRVAIPSNQTTYTVKTTAVTDNSVIIVQQTTDSVGLPGSPTCGSSAVVPAVNPVTNHVAGTSFTMGALNRESQVTCFNYWIFN